MTDARWQRTWEIFHDALEREPGTRAHFVAEACAGDHALAAEVNALLSAHDSDHVFLQQPPDLLAAVDAPGELAPGARVGPYVIRRSLGSGGMGVVYEADQEGEISRRVALKLIRSGMESREIVARFGIERQAMALMSHPNIATAYDVGVSDGRPYFAMEYVEGRPLTEFCDAAQLTIGERLELFLQVCDAIQHAHQKGVLHRDLKPSNVLAGRDSGRTILKVIDFGIAKAAAPRAGSRSFVTEVGRFIGTPEYMSPEQAGVTRIDVDTRADIYSLGVMLYELLSGVLPVDPERLRSSSFGEIERLLFVEELPRPSRRVAALGADAENIARARQLTAAALVKWLSGELDWMTGKAMEKERDRRYASVSELAADLRRFLANEPVLAGPPGAAYRVRKFVRRHRAAVAAAAALVLVTAGFIVSLILSNARTARALQEAGIERQRSDQVSSFLTSLFLGAKPTTAKANATTARELLDQGAADIRAQLGDQPVVQARLMATMGEVYTNLGLRDQAEALLLDALDVRRRTLGADHREVADTLQRLGRNHEFKGEYRESLARLREALGIYRRAPAPDLAEISTTLNHLGTALRHLGELDEAERTLQEALAIRREQLKVEDLAVAEVLMRLGNTALTRKDLDAAERYAREGAGLMVKLLGEDHIDVARARNELATVYHQKRDDAQAETVFRQVLATYVAVLGPDHPDVAIIKNNLGASLHRQRKLDEAESLARESVATRRRESGDRHPQVAMALNNLALVLRSKGDLAAGTVLLREALVIMRATYGDGHANATTTLANLAEMAHEAGAADAEALLEQALAARRKTLPPADPSTAISLLMFAHARAERGDARGAEPMLREALAALEKGAPDSPRVVQARAYLGGALADLGRFDEAGPLLRDAQKVLEKGGSVHARQYVDKQLARFPR